MSLAEPYLKSMIFLLIKAAAITNTGFDSQPPERVIPHQAKRRLFVCSTNDLPPTPSHQGTREQLNLWSGVNIERTNAGTSS